MVQATDISTRRKEKRVDDPREAAQPVLEENRAASLESPSVVPDDAPTNGATSTPSTQRAQEQTEVFTAATPTEDRTANPLPSRPPTPEPTNRGRGGRILGWLGLLTLLIVIGALGFAVYRQTQWGQHVYAVLRHSRATATAQAHHADAIATVAAGYVEATATAQAQAYAHLANDATATSSTTTLLVS